MTRFRGKFNLRGVNVKKSMERFSSRERKGESKSQFIAGDELISCEIKKCKNSFLSKIGMDVGMGVSPKSKSCQGEVSLKWTKKFHLFSSNFIYFRTYFMLHLSC